jgi:hypothetical protein
MDILASMLAYLGCVSGIVCALVLSFVVYFSHPDRSAAHINHPVATANAAVRPVATASAAVAKVTTIAQVNPAQVNPTPKAEPKDAPKNASVALSDTTTAAAPRATVPVSTRHKVQLSRPQHYRRLVEEERARRWAYQQDPDFEARFLGYAD